MNLLLSLEVWIILFGMIHLPAYTSWRPIKIPTSVFILIFDDELVKGPYFSLTATLGSCNSMHKVCGSAVTSWDCLVSIPIRIPKQCCAHFTRPATLTTTAPITMNDRFINATNHCEITRLALIVWLGFICGWSRSTSVICDRWQGTQDGKDLRIAQNVSNGLLL